MTSGMAFWQRSHFFACQVSFPGFFPTPVPSPPSPGDLGDQGTWLRRRSDVPMVLGMMPGAEACRCLFADRRRWKNPVAVGCCRMIPNHSQASPCLGIRGTQRRGACRVRQLNPMVPSCMRGCLRWQRERRGNEHPGFLPGAAAMALTWLLSQKSFSQPPQGGMAMGCASPHTLLQALCGEQRGEERLPKACTDTCSCLPFLFFFPSFYGNR